MKYIPTILAAIVMLSGYLLRSGAKRKLAAMDAEPPDKQQARRVTIGLTVFIIGAWLFVGCLITLIFGKPAGEEFAIYIIPPRSNINIAGYVPSVTMLVGWGVMAALITGAVLLRIFFIPKLSDVPGPFQNALETIVETVENYTTGQNVILGRPMFGYIFTVGVMLLGNVIAELMGFRSPSSDLMFTLALSLSVFLMANWYGLRKLSARGRLKNLAHPTPLLLPIRIITDLVNPFSMACRLFGNTISGMIVMDLIYSALGNFSTGIPSIVGLYFNIFAALIQMIIFITLGLAAINEATTESEA